MNDQILSLTKLSVNDINIIITGLGKLPLEVSMDLWARIKSQTEEQIKTITKSVSDTTPTT